MAENLTVDNSSINVQKSSYFRAKQDKEAMEGLSKLLDAYAIDTKEEASKCKNVMEILDVLAEQIDPATGLFFSTSVELKKAKSDLQQAKRSYFEQQILYNALCDVAEPDDKDKISELDTEVRSAIQDCIAVSEVVQYLTLPSDVPAVLPLGITDANLSSAARSISEQDLMNAVIPAVEKRIFTKARDLMECYSDGKVYQSSTEFAAIVERDSRLLADESEHLVLLEQERIRTLFDFSLIFQEASILLYELIKKVSVQNHVTLIEKSAESAVNMWRVLLVKAKTLHQKVLCKTYTAERIPALHVLRSKMLEEKASADISIMSIRNKLRDYDQLGSDFKVLVEKIRHLEGEIATRQWGLQEVETSFE